MYRYRRFYVVERVHVPYWDPVGLCHGDRVLQGAVPPLAIVYTVVSIHRVPDCTINPLEGSGHAVPDK